MNQRTDHVTPPSRLLLAMEGRAVLEMGACFFAYPLLRAAPRGDGHPVLVLPGLAATDRSTEMLRSYLADLGYSPHGWELGRNYGHHHTVEGELLDRLLELYDRSGRKVSIVGWSLGGVLARELAFAAPDAVRCVISLGSPIAACGTTTNAWHLYEYTSGRRRAGKRDAHAHDDEHCPSCAHTRRRPPRTVPTTSIFSRTDGVVSWRASLEEESETSENIEVEGSHCGLGHNPAVLYAVADRLAQPEGEWKPFDRRGWRGFIYRDPRRGLHRTVA